MIVNHSSGARANLRDILRTFCLIVADDSELIGTLNNGAGYRARWANVDYPTDLELRSVGYSYLIEQPLPDLEIGQTVSRGAVQFIEGSWVQLWNVVEAPPPEVPEQVYGHQMRAILKRRMLGNQTLMEKVLEAVNQMPEVPANPTDPSRADVLDALNGPVMRRDSPTIAMLAALFGLSSQYVDQLFIDAANWLL